MNRRLEHGDVFFVITSERPTTFPMLPVRRPRFPSRMPSRSAQEFRDRTGSNPLKWGGIDSHPAPPSAAVKLPKPFPQAEPRLFACLRPHAGGASGARPAHFRVSHLGRSDHSAPQRADRANFSEGSGGECRPRRNGTLVGGISATAMLSTNCQTPGRSARFLIISDSIAGAGKGTILLGCRFYRARHIGFQITR
jgi:hypothetical protein